MSEQRTLPIDQAESSREAYCEAVRGCGFSGSAEAVAVWLVESGRKDVWAGEAVVRSALPAYRALAGRIGVGRSSVGRGLRELASEGVLVRTHEGEAVLSLARVVRLAEARTAEPAGFAAGWQPTRERVPRVPKCPTVSHRVPRVPSCPAVSHGDPQEGALRAPSPRKGYTNIPSTPSTETESEFGAGHGGTSRDIAGHDGTGGTRRDIAGGQGSAARVQGSGIEAGKSALGRSAAWQALGPADFQDASGRRRVPALSKLQAAFAAAAAAGLVDGDYQGKLKWLATVHDCAHRAKAPIKALVWRTAAGALDRSGQASWDWAKQKLHRPPRGDPIVAATAAACSLPTDH